MIEVINLTKKYGSNLAVDNISFRVEAGKIYGFLGPNGAGKSTTMNIITGCLAPTEGEVYINGHSIFEDPVEAKSCIGYLPEQPPLYMDMTPLEYLNFVAEAKGIRRDKIEDEVTEVMAQTDITSVSNRLIRNLSKGYRQRVGIAQAMLGDPDIIILDEPTVGLDPQQIIEIRDLIKSLGADHTVILSSHILHEVASVCDNIIVISHGKLVANDTMENISLSMRRDNTMSVTVKATEEQAKSIFAEIDGITGVVYNGSDGDCVSFKVKYPTDIDLREKVSLAFFGRGCAVLSMTVEEEGLEEIFLKLTESAATSVHSDNIDTDNIDGDSDSDITDNDDDIDDTIDDDTDSDDDDDDSEDENYVYNPEDYLGGVAATKRADDKNDDNNYNGSDDTADTNEGK